MRFWNSSPPRMWRSGFQPRLRKMQDGEEAEEVAAEGGEQPLFLPTPSFMASAGEE